MNYQHHYKKLIDRAKTRNLDSEFIERHHIIPRCLGGSDSLDNLVALTPAEHYVAHQLLVKIYPDNDLLVYACRMMCSGINGRSNKQYAWLRERFISAISQRQKDLHAKKIGFHNYQAQANFVWEEYVNKKQPTEEIAKSKKISATRVRGCLLYYAIENDLLDVLEHTRREFKIQTSRIVRSEFTAEQESRRIDAIRKADMSSRNEMFRKTRKGEGNPMFGKKRIPQIVTCPHCNKSGAKSQMDRWHFNNCKENHES